MFEISSRHTELMIFLLGRSSGERAEDSWSAL
jgi:hypothetical protein